MKRKKDRPDAGDAGARKENETSKHDDAGIIANRRDRVKRFLTKSAVAVHDGMIDYSSLPTDLIGRAPPGRLVIVQIGRPVNGCKERSIFPVLERAIETGGASGVLLWARDTPTYFSIIEELETLGVTERGDD
jgi:hypothetical protein